MGSRLIPGLAVALCLFLSFPALADSENVSTKPWEGLDSLKHLLTSEGFTIEFITSVPERPRPGVLIVTEPRPVPAQLSGLWDYVRRGGKVILPLEVPVALDDPLVNMVSAGGGVKVVDKEYCFDGHDWVPIPPANYIHVTLDERGIYGFSVRFVLNMPTYLSDFVPPDATRVIERAAVFFSEKASLKGSGPAGAWLKAASLLQAGNGWAFVVADHSLLTNQMLMIEPWTVINLIRSFTEAIGSPQVVYWLGPRPSETGYVPPKGTGTDTPEGTGTDTAEGRGTERTRPQDLTWLLVLALAWAFLTPLYSLRERAWGVEALLNAREAETRFRRLIRGLERFDDYRVPARQLAAEVGKVLPEVLGIEPARLFAGYLPHCLKAFDRLNPGATARARARFARRTRRLLAALDKTAPGAAADVAASGRGAIHAGPRVPGKRFLFLYVDANWLVREIGGTHLHARRQFRRNRQA